eukprot:TRINITY_DN2305_c0_g2_i3.p1 TRINITY_DN2305_c0_g2~~TRINITY_DN2305_c0_g2_i3.p1  ORF type:complete len:1032 (+),score=211.17 TRINITY_DN2305_c0_g2_i3:59-3154(+)
MRILKQLVVIIVILSFLAKSTNAIEILSSVSGNFKEGVEAALRKQNSDGGIKGDSVSLNSVTAITPTTVIGSIINILPTADEIDILKTESIASIGPINGNFDTFKDVSPSDIVSVRLSMADELFAMLSLVHGYDETHLRIFYDETFLDEKFGGEEEFYAVLRESKLDEPIITKINSTVTPDELKFESTSALILAPASYIGVVKSFLTDYKDADQTVAVLSSMRDIDFPGVIVTNPIPRLSTIHPSVINFKSICDEANAAGTSCSSTSEEAYEGFMAASVAIAAMIEVAESGTVTSNSIRTLLSGSTTLFVANTWMGPITGDCSSITDSKSCPCNRLTRTIYGGTINNSGVWEENLDPFIFDSCGVVTSEREVIYFGQVAAFSGPSSNLGECMNAGILAAFHQHNTYNHLSKYIAKLKVLDDAYEPEQSMEAMKVMLEDPEIFAMVGSVGTPTSKVTFPLAVEAGIPFIGPFTGAEILRRPFFEDVINIRASYYDETAAMTQYLVDVRNFKRISIMYQHDSFGQAGYDGLLPRLASRMLWIHSEGVYERNTIDIEKGVEAIFEKDVAPEAIVYFGTALPLNAFVRNVRDRGWMGVIICVSFVGAEYVAELLELPVYRDNVIVTQAVPSPSDTSIPLVLEHLEMMKETSPSMAASFCSLEGYIAGGMASLSIDMSRTTLTRDSFLDVIYESGVFSYGGISIGPYGRNTDCVEDTPGCMCNQGSHSVFLTKIEPKGTLSEVEEFREFSFTTCGFHDLYEAPECDSSFWQHSVSTCKDSGTRDVVFSWTLPYPKDHSLPWNCQNGEHLPHQTSVNCEYLQPTTGLGIVLMTLIILCVMILITMGVWVHLWKGRRSVNNGQPILLIFGIIGALLTCGSAFLLMFEPSNWRCIAMPTLGSIGFTLMNASLCMKVWRIKKIFLNRKLQKRRLSVNLLLRYMVFIVLIDIGIIATWWIVDHPEETTNIKVEDGFEVVEKTCEAGELFIIVVAYKVLLVIASCYLSFKIRHSPDRSVFTLICIFIKRKIQCNNCEPMKRQ